MCYFCLPFYLSLRWDTCQNNLSGNETGFCLFSFSGTFLSHKCAFIDIFRISDCISVPENMPNNSVSIGFSIKAVALLAVADFQTKGFCFITLLQFGICFCDLNPNPDIPVWNGCIQTSEVTRAVSSAFKTGRPRNKQEFSPRGQLVTRRGTRKGKGKGNNPFSRYGTYFSFVLCTAEPFSSA